MNAEGGIEICLTAEKPVGVQEENWLPIDRKDEEIDIILRIYVTRFGKNENMAGTKGRETLVVVRYRFIYLFKKRFRYEKD